MSIWIVIVTLSALTYGLRVSFLLGARHPLPTAWLHALRFTPPAVLAAFVVPTLVGSGNLLEPEAKSVLLAAGVAALVAWRFQNVLVSVVTDMVALWVFQAVL
jgi:branched-subunit amino acid transport protein